MSIQNRDLSYYLSLFENQIEYTEKDSYVILNLEKKDVDRLSDILYNPYYINDIINMTYKNPFYIDQSRRNEDGYPKNWWLMITGFKHGARKNSPRKLGLVAYDPNYLTRDYIITNVFYDSYVYSLDPNKYIDLNYDINFIRQNEFYYLSNYPEYNELNYIKENKIISKKKNLLKKNLLKNKFILCHNIL